MCTGTIGLCQCVRCIEHPTPGKLLRIEFCPKQQDKLAGAWTPSSPEIEKLVPCAGLILNRIRDPDSCHFKKDDTKMQVGSETTITTTGAGTDVDMTELESVQNEEAVKDTANCTNTVSQTSTAGPHSDIRFTPINGSEVTRHAFATRAEDKSNATEDKTTAGDVSMEEGDKAEGVDKTGKDKVNNENDHADADKMDIDTDMLPAVATTIAGPAQQETPPYVTEQADKQLMPSNTTTANTANAGSASTPPSQLTPSKRKRLPHSRPQTPRVLEATTAAAASEQASRVAGGPWTHVETVKMLLLRSKGIEFDSERVAQYLPGRDAAACLDRLTGLAVKHGYEDYI